MIATAEAIERHVPQELSGTVTITPHDAHGLPLFVSPRDPRLAGSVDAAVSPDSVPAAPEEAGSRVYLQVSSSQNRAWSAELARQLEQQGPPASVLDPRAGEEGFRVVLGPYPSREAAESTGRRLGRPYFIYQPDR